ncbi:MAG: hypothetical protein NWF13_03160 [Candidatus Bathyarchaeota archaeon]|nr:hypothetical protein [Candidatus Bathyarchaeota archaeon]
MCKPPRNITLLTLVATMFLAGGSLFLTMSGGTRSPCPIFRKRLFPEDKSVTSINCSGLDVLN